MITDQSLKRVFTVLSTHLMEVQKSMIKEKIVTTLKMETVMQVVNVDCIQSPAFVINDKLISFGDDTYLPEEVMSVISPTQWSSAFLSN